MSTLQLKSGRVPKAKAKAKPGTNALPSWELTRPIIKQPAAPKESGLPALIDAVCSKWPDCFDLANVRPVIIGIHRVMRGQGLSNREIHRFLLWYTGRTDYRNRFLADGGMDALRINLEGATVDSNSTKLGDTDNGYRSLFNYSII